MPRPSLPSGPTAPALLQAMRFGRDPHAFLEDCVRDHGDPFTLRLPGEPLRLVTGDPALIKQVFALSPDDYEQRTASFPLNIGERSLLFLDGEEHRRERHVMMPPLHGERLRGYMASMREVTARAVSRFTVGSVQPLHALFQEITLDVILHCVFGVSGGETAKRLRRALLGWMNGTLTPLTFFASMIFTPTRVRHFLDEAAHDSLQWAAGGRDRGRTRILPWQRWADDKAYVLALLRDEVLRCRGGNGLSAARTDVLALLARARYEDGELMPLDDVVDELVTLLVGGHETTANSLAWTLYHLLAHPAALERARDESRAGAAAAARAEGVPFLDAAIKESMRLTPIAPAVSRNLRRPLRLGAYDVPAGTILWPCVYLAHRRPEVWPEPSRFRPERFLERTPAPSEFLPFGGGRRACIGMAFASMEMRVVLAELLARVQLRLVPGARVRPEFRGITIAPSNDLRAVVDGVEDEGRGGGRKRKGAKGQKTRLLSA